MNLDSLEPFHQEAHFRDRRTELRGDALSDVRRVDPNRALVLSRSGSGYEYTWCLALEPAGERTTRLVSRVRYRGSKAIHAIAEPIVFGMMRRWFTTVKDRAERGQRPEAIQRAGQGGNGGAHP